MQEYWDQAPAGLTFAEIEEMTMRLSIPAQKNAYVARSAFSSWFIPGLGQFKNGDALLGTAFLVGDLAITAGSLWAFYAMLPPDLKFDQLDYYTTPFADIAAAWEAAFLDASLEDTLPYLGLAAATTIVKTTLSVLSARHAADLAEQRIRAGEVVFTPKAGIITDAVGRVGLGFGWRY
jgi:hypothetical protein